MVKLLSIVLCICLLLGLVSCAATPSQVSGRTPTAAISRHPTPASWTVPAPMLPIHFDPNNQAPFQIDLRSCNLTQLDLSQSLPDLFYADFDTQTQWPAAGKMPAGFDAAKILELGKNPGLGMRALHAQGITGKGVGIAIIDQPMLVDHPEYSGQLRFYEEINIRSTAVSEMHGPAVASIAVGKSIGVAPDADLYYIATFSGDRDPENGQFTFDFKYIAQGIRRILEINQNLPEGHKIRVISISNGWKADQKGYDEITAVVKQAKDAGMLVVSSSIEDTFGFKFQGLGRDPLADPDQFTAYAPGLWWANDYYNGARFSDRLLVPMDSRTTAGSHGPQDYAFYRQGGWSWSIPYIAATYALAAQVKPSITPEEFWSKALKTGRTIQLDHKGESIPFGPILDPAALMAAIK